jgi:hypothetical protein
MFQPGQQGLRREQLDAGSGQFDGERQAIQVCTNLSESRGVGRGHLERRLNSLGTLEEEGNGGIVRQGIYGGKLFKIRERQWRNGKLVFPLDVQGGATGDQDAEVWATGQQVRQLWCRWQELLEVVEQEQQVLVSQKCFEEVQQGSRSTLFEVERLGDGGHNQVGAADRSERDKGDTVSEIIKQVGGDLESKAGLADTTGAGKGHKTDVGAAQEGTGCRHLVLAPDEGGELRGQIVLRPGFRLGWLPRRKYV